MLFTLTTLSVASALTCIEEPDHPFCVANYFTYQGPGTCEDVGYAVKTADECDWATRAARRRRSLGSFLVLHDDTEVQEIHKSMWQPFCTYNRLEDLHDSEVCAPNDVCDWEAIWLNTLDDVDGTEDQPRSCDSFFPGFTSFCICKDCADDGTYVGYDFPPFWEPSKKCCSQQTNGFGFCGSPPKSLIGAWPGARMSQKEAKLQALERLLDDLN